MWIVSQDKEDIYIVENFKNIGKRRFYNGTLDESEHGYSICLDEEIRLGIYTTEEKAKAVMKLLIDSQTKFLVLKNTDIEPDLKEYLKERQYGVVTVKGYETEISSLGNQVFFMPQDDEVVV